MPIAEEESSKQNENEKKVKEKETSEFELLFKNQF